MPTSVVVLSDLHLGAPDSLLRPKQVDPATGLADATAYTNQLDSLLLGPIRRQIGKAKYLVLNGDVLDFALQSFADVFAAGSAFFKAVAASGIFQEIVYVAGNHDHKVWDFVEHEDNVIKPLTKGKLPAAYSHIQAGVLNAATGSLELPGVAKPYGDFFLKGLFQLGSAGPSLPINVVYPNLFITGAPKAAQPLVVTHGHFFFLPWIVLTEVFPKNLGISGGYSLTDLEMVNAPITELAWCALGQAGKLTEAANRVYGGIDSGNPKPLDRVLDELAEYLENRVFTDKGWLGLKEKATEAIIYGFKEVVKSLVDRAVTASGNHRGSASCLDDRDTQARIRTYLALTRSQFSDLQPGNALIPSKVIFAHTHTPIRPDHNASLVVGWQGTKYEVQFYNPGGWQTTAPKPPAVALTVDDTGNVGCVRLDV
jgi:hypothetical protein